MKLKFIDTKKLDTMLRMEKICNLSVEIKCIGREKLNKNSLSEESLVEDLEQPSSYYLLCKRVVDVFGAIMGLIVFSPIFLLYLLLICEVRQEDRSFLNKCELERMVISFTLENFAQW